MFTKLMTIFLCSVISMVLYVAGYSNGFQKGEQAGITECQDMLRDNITEVMANYIIARESSHRPGQWGDFDKPFRTYGKAQFQKRTFYWMAGMAKLDKPDWKNEEQQVRLLKWALVNGYGSHWGKNYTKALHVAVLSLHARHTLRASI